MNAPKPVLQILRVDDLAIDPSYQKSSIRKALVQRIIENLDEGLLGELIVNQRTEARKYYVIDGQHRMLALRHLKVPDVRCMVYAKLTLEEEARKFYEWNNNDSRKPTKPGENFKARITAKEPTALDITNIVYGLGLKIAFHGGGAANSTIASVSTLERIYKELGRDVLLRTLFLIKNSWNGDATALQYGFLNGISCFIEQAGEYFDNKDFIDKFKKIDPEKIFREAGGLAKFSKSKSQIFAKVICFYYNKNRKLDKIPESLFSDVA